MFLKWIICKVYPDNVRSFSEAQELWRSIAVADGFIGQFGGWDLKSVTPCACILGLWRNRAAYDAFMLNLHDQVTNSNLQSRTYYQINVELFEAVLSMSGHFENLTSAYSKGSFLRIADCNVREDRIDHFVQVQESIWIPAMSKTIGMLGGSFNRSLQMKNRFLVVSIWENENLHTQYAKEKLPELSLKSTVSEDTNSVVGRFIKLEKSWLVQPLAK